MTIQEHEEEVRFQIGGVMLAGISAIESPPRPNRWFKVSKTFDSVEESPLFNQSEGIVLGAVEIPLTQ
jgi:hypothetical protein